MTKAGTICGSCKPLLAGLTGETAALTPGYDLGWLKGICAAALVIALLCLFLGPLPFTVSVQAPAWDHLWLDSSTKQITGFTLLALALISLLLSLSKRWQLFRKLGSFRGWRLMHTVLGTAAIAALVVHTGLNTGANLNQWLMIDFSLLLFAGAIVGLVIGLEHRIKARQARRLRSTLTWTHTLLFWPLPVLLSFHVLSVYWF